MPTIDNWRALQEENKRLTAEQAVMRQWIAEALQLLQAQEVNTGDAEASALIESGRRLVDGGPDDLLKGVG